MKKVPAAKKKKIKEEIRKNHMDLADRVLKEVENPDDNLVKRIRESGAEMHDDLLLKD